MKAKIIIGFQGIGKTTYHELNRGTSLDIDIKDFKYFDSEDNYLDLRDNQRIDFPENVIEFIKNNIGSYKTILVHFDIELVQCLRKEGLEFTIVYPSKERKKEFYLNQVGKNFIEESKYLAPEELWNTSDEESNISRLKYKNEKEILNFYYTWDINFDFIESFKFNKKLKLENGYLDKKIISQC